MILYLVVHEDIYLTYFSRNIQKLNDQFGPIRFASDSLWRGTWGMSHSIRYVSQSPSNQLPEPKGATFQLWNIIILACRSLLEMEFWFAGWMKHKNINSQYCGKHQHNCGHYAQRFAMNILSCIYLEAPNSDSSYVQSGSPSPICLLVHTPCIVPAACLPRSL